MSDRHVVVGAGAIGRAVAAHLAERGSHVVVVTRSGTNTGVADVEHVAADASDADRLTEFVEGANVFYNCANPGDYTKWMSVWPPLAFAMLTAGLPRAEPNSLDKARTAGHQLALLRYARCAGTVAAEISALRKAVRAVVPKKRPKNLLIGSWNLRAFGDVTPKWSAAAGDTPKRDWRAVALIAVILARFDVIAVQEVRRETEALRFLLSGSARTGG